ncbi:uncharacterized protein [Watersipora subatra]|uniref:uncharacterized protein n=1 Tax=Watersipora subatra TaxID=2589382 RepID=UPI00355B8A13
MKTFRGTPHPATGETANFMMMGRELRLSDQLSKPITADSQAVQPFVLELANWLEETYEIIQERQMKVRIEDDKEPPLFEVGDLVLLGNKRRRRGENPKLQPRYMGLYTITRCHANNTNQVERQGQVSIQSEERLKPYFAREAPPRPPTRQGETDLRPTAANTDMFRRRYLEALLEGEGSISVDHGTTGGHDDATNQPGATEAQRDTQNLSLTL